WGRTVADRRTHKQRYRELLIEPPQLQELPPTAMVFTHSGATGRRTLLVDANPGIITLPTAHSMEFEEELCEQDEPLVQPDEDAGESAEVEPPEVPAPRRARHALPRGASRPVRIVPPLKPNGRHKADPPTSL
ncbi:MAG TPA: hypothetical protein VF174_09250, partial [Micromonosporaceae bacterium]